MLTQGIHHHSEVLALQDLLGLALTCPDSMISRSLENQSHTRFGPIGYDQIEVGQALDLIPATENPCHDRVPDVTVDQEGLVTRTRKGAWPSWLKWLISLHFLEQMRWR